jgi:hypothetical protein
MEVRLGATPACERTCIYEFSVGLGWASNLSFAKASDPRPRCIWVRGSSAKIRTVRIHHLLLTR